MLLLEDGLKASKLSLQNSKIRIIVQGWTSPTVLGYCSNEVARVSELILRVRELPAKSTLEVSGRDLLVLEFVLETKLDLDRKVRRRCLVSYTRNYCSGGEDKNSRLKSK